MTPESQDLIGNQLRKVYADMVAEPLPDRFADLLSQLAATEKRS
ncbi:MAG: NepR family anti-sigma factor [Beijerinckiaceae bacterium]